MSVEVYELYDKYIYLNGKWERIGGSTSNIDDHISSTSKNPVQNRVIYDELRKKPDISDDDVSANSTYSSLKINEILSDVSKNELGLKIIDGKLNQIYSESAESDEEVSDPIVLDSTFKDMSIILTDIVNAILLSANGAGINDKEASKFTTYSSYKIEELLSDFDKALSEIIGEELP